MLFKDGTFKFYIIQHHQDDGKWTQSNLDHFKIGKRWNDARDKVLEPYRSFSACGECWQQTGEHGSFDKERAVQLLQNIRRHNPDHEFRIVCVAMAQMTIPVQE